MAVADEKKSRRNLTWEDVLLFRAPLDLQAAPDGRRVAFVVKSLDEGRDGYATRIWLADAEGGAARPITAGPSDSCPRWSPDGTRLAFLSGRGGDGPEVYVLPLEGGEAVRVSRGLKGAMGLAWSPDGSAIAVLAVGEWPQADDELMKAIDWRPDASSQAGSGDRDAPAAARAGSGGADDSGGSRTPSAAGSTTVHLTERLDYRFDGIGWHDNRRRHLFVVPVPDDAAAEPAEPRQVTRGPFDVDAFSWRPGTSRIAFIANRDEDAQFGWRKDLWEVDAAAAAEPRLLAKNAGPLWSLAWSPDGSALALIGHDGRLEYATQLTLFIYRDGDGLFDATADFPQGVGEEASGDVGGSALPVPRWTPDGGSVVFASFRDGRVRLHAADVRSSGPGRPAPVAELPVQPDESPSWLAPATGRIFYVGQDWTLPPEVYALPVPGLGTGGDGAGDRTAGGAAGVAAFSTRLTRLNDAVAERLPMGETRRLRWESEDGLPIEGWVQLPPGHRDGDRRPLVVHIHGGPHGAFMPAFHFAHHVHALSGRAVFFCNPRGSAGYGQDFEAACIRDWGGMDYRDIMAGVDHVVALGIADESRMTVTGISYGGFMTSWIVGHTDRFACAIPEMPVTNLVSMYGTSDVGTHFIPYEGGGTPWEALETLWEHSPLRHVENCTTPTLVIVGEADHRCPPGEGEQFYARLRRRGVPCALASFPGASHAFSVLGTPSQRVQRLRLIDAWIRRWTDA